MLSAATKFLWLRHRDVVVIHDSQARIALGAAVGDYAGYLDRWRAEYSRLASRVTDACERLQTARKLGEEVALEAKRMALLNGSSGESSTSIFGKKAGHPDSDA